ncbi:hypothetical protein HYQ46_011008 [Verticillium longisporum]|nr:hypothetical protein HYQ46_011008 [Verticillium longisporum]
MAAHENMGVDPDPQPRVSEAKASHADMTAGRYLATRFSTLKPPMLAAPNPWRLVRMLDRHQWAFFGVAFAAWVCLPCSFLFGGAALFVVTVQTASYGL